MARTKNQLSMKTIAVAIGVMCVIVSVVSGIMSSSINSNIALLIEDWGVSYRDSAEKHEDLAELNSLLGYGGAILQFKNMVLRSDTSKSDEVRASFLKAQKILSEYKEHPISVEERKAVDALLLTLREYGKKVDLAESLIRQGKAPIEVDDQVSVSDASALAAIAMLQIKAANDMAARDKKIEKGLGDISTSVNWVAIATSALLIMLLIMVIVGYRQLKKQLGGDLGEILELTDEVSKGRLEVVENSLDGPQTGVLAATHRTVNQLGKVVSRINTVSSAIVANSASISTSTAALSEKAEKQHENVFSATVAITQMVSTLKDNASNAEAASTLANNAHESARKGGDVVTKVVNAMTNINTSSQKIADIIRVIDDIAFQTNLLALNAAVEAARAGENGRGFAVVAAEVRNLAQRSATAAKEIKGLIEDSTGKVEDGARLANAAGETLTEIIGSVEAVNDVVVQMTRCNREQAVAIDQVNSSMQEVECMRTASEVETRRVTDGNRKLRDSAKELTQAMSFFLLDGDAVRRTELRSSSSIRPAEQTQSDSSWLGSERRAADRPWSQSGGASQPSANHHGMKPAKIAGGMESWESF